MRKSSERRRALFTAQRGCFVTAEHSAGDRLIATSYSVNDRLIAAESGINDRLVATNPCILVSPCQRTHRKHPSLLSGSGLLATGYPPIHAAQAAPAALSPKENDLAPKLAVRKAKAIF
jgi:hypothetical protein